MRRVWAVVRREFVERVRKKSFWVMALLGPLFFAAVFLMPLLMSRGGGVKRLALVDRTRPRSAPSSRRGSTRPSGFSSCAACRAERAWKIRWRVKSG